MKPTALRPQPGRRSPMRFAAVALAACSSAPPAPIQSSAPPVAVAQAPIPKAQVTARTIDAVIETPSVDVACPLHWDEVNAPGRIPLHAFDPATAQQDGCGFFGAQV